MAQDAVRRRNVMAVTAVTASRARWKGNSLPSLSCRAPVAAGQCLQRGGASTAEQSISAEHHIVCTLWDRLLYELAMGSRGRLWVSRDWVSGGARPLPVVDGTASGSEIGALPQPVSPMPKLSPLRTTPGRRKPQHPPASML